MSGGWSAHAYRRFRVLLGAYLAVHFATLVPYAAELFSSEGMLPDGSASPLLGAFPNGLALWDAPDFVTALLVAAVGLSIAIAAGRADRLAAVALWYVGACLLGRNPLISNPSMPYVGWLLLAHASLPRQALDRGLPRSVFTAAWVVLALSYGYGGLEKLASPSWMDGSALTHVLRNPLARPTALRDALLSLPDLWLRFATWGALVLELGFPLLALTPRLRALAWLATTAMHGSLLVLLDFADLTMGMLVFHAFVFDPAWLRWRPRLRAHSRAPLRVPSRTSGEAPVGVDVSRPGRGEPRHSSGAVPPVA